MPLLRLYLDHGLGDCVHIAHLLRIYRRFGYDFELAVHPNKAWLMRAAGFRCLESEWAVPDFVHLPYLDPLLIVSDDDTVRYWERNKTAAASRYPPLPPIGSVADVWSWLDCWPKVDYTEALTHERSEVARYLHGLRRPICVVHPRGVSNNARKAMPFEVLSRLCEAVIHVLGGSVLVDGAAPYLHERCRPLNWTFHGRTEYWVALLEACDVFVGVDAGPFHLARYTKTKAVGYFPTAFHFPSRYALPDPAHRYVVPMRLRNWANAVGRDYDIACWDEDPVETIIKQIWGLLQ